MGPRKERDGGSSRGNGVVVRAERKARAPGETEAQRGKSIDTGRASLAEAGRSNSALAKRPEPGQQMVPSRLELMLAEAARSFQLTERAKAESE
jgi:hypothetical protein